MNQVPDLYLSNNANIHVQLNINGNYSKRNFKFKSKIDLCSDNEIVFLSH